MTGVQTCALPIFAEIVIGRKVGYDIREVRLDETTEAISGTKIRKQKNDDKVS